MRIDHRTIRHTESAASQFARQVLTSPDLERLFWLSGSACAGKTTVSSVIAERLGFNVYHCDEREDAQRERADSNRHPNWFSYSRLTGDDLWLQPVEQHLAHQERAREEQFEFIVEDLAEALKADSKPLLYDGFVSPYILASIIPSNAHAFYLVSSDEFQRNFYRQRSWIKEVLAKTSEFELASSQRVDELRRNRRASHSALLDKMS